MRLLIAVFPLLLLAPGEALASGIGWNPERVLYGGMWLIAIFCFFHTRHTKPPRVKDQDPAPLKGVSGWLLLFILGSSFDHLLTILVALEGLIKGDDTPIPGFSLGVRLASSAQILISSIYIYGYYLLYRVRPGALRLNKILLVLAPLYMLMMPALLLASLTLTTDIFQTWEEFIDAYNSPENFGVVDSVMHAIFVSIIWYLYLSCSKRVRNTWSLDTVPAKSRDTPPPVQSCEP